VGLLIGFGGPARAIELPEPASYVRKNFTVEDGLLSNNVNAVLQTRDGFLWIGTQDGLLRFDGRHFTPIQFLPQASPILVNALAEAPDGALWGVPKPGWREFRAPGPLNRDGQSPPFTILVPAMAIRSSVFTSAGTAISGWVHTPGSTASSTADFQ
jgi:hypothetical protein